MPLVTVCSIADNLLKLRSQLEEFFGGKKPLTMYTDDAVITGLAMHAAVISGYVSDPGCFVEILPLSIGIVPPPALSSFHHLSKGGEKGKLTNSVLSFYRRQHSTGLLCA